MRILIMGLPGSGKTTLAKVLAEWLKYKHINADEIRKQSNDWDFSIEGRIRQARRLRDLSMQYDNSITDFICPLAETRAIFAADYTIWMDTLKEGRFANTNQLFEPPEFYQLRIMTLQYRITDIIKMIAIFKHRPAYYEIGGRRVLI